MSLYLRYYLHNLVIMNALCNFQDFASKYSLGQGVLLKRLMKLDYRVVVQLYFDNYLLAVELFLSRQNTRIFLLLSWVFHQPNKQDEQYAGRKVAILQNEIIFEVCSIATCCFFRFSGCLFSLLQFPVLQGSNEEPETYKHLSLT